MSESVIYVLVVKGVMYVWECFDVVILIYILRERGRESECFMKMKKEREGGKWVFRSISFTCLGG